MSNFNNILYYDEHTYTVGFIDNTEWDSAGNTYVSGWSINPFTTTLPDLLIYTDLSGKIMGTTHCEIARSDVAKSYTNDQILLSGWKITLHKKLNQEIKVYAYIENQNAAFLLQNWAKPVDHELMKIEDNLWLSTSGIHAPDKTAPYYSCEYIEGGIIFTVDHAVQMCCTVNLNSLAPHEMICMGKTGLENFSIKTLLQKRETVIKENQKEGYFACRGCPELQKRMWPIRNYIFNYINISNDFSCNLKCKYCNIIKGGQTQTTTPYYEILSAIKILESSKLLASNTRVTIAGGEPTMMDGLDNLLEYLTRFNFIVSVATNGTIFSQAIYNALKSGKINITISVDAVSDDVYSSIKERNFCNQVWKNIDKYAEANKDLVTPKIILIEENIHEMELFIQRCLKAGVSSVIFDYDHNVEPSEKIINAIKRFDQLCHSYGIKGLSVWNEKI